MDSLQKSTRSKNYDRQNWNCFRGDDLKAGEALLFDWFGGKFIATGEEIEEAKNNDAIRKIYFNNGTAIKRIK